MSYSQMLLSTVGLDCTLRNAKQPEKVKTQNTFYQSYMFVEHPVGSKKNWETLTKEAYAIYMIFKKFSYYLHNSKVTNLCAHTPLNKFLSAHIL